MIRVVCGCGRVFKAEDRHSGKRTRCPACGTSLIIGQTPSSASGEGELEEVPSWWYPSASPVTTGADKPHPGGNGDPEAIRTTVLESGLAPGGGGRSDAFPPGGPPVQEALAAAGRSSWTLAGAVAATAALTFGVLGWIWWVAPVSSGTTANRAPHEAGRGLDSGIVPDPTGSTTVDAGFRGNEWERPARSARRLRMLVPAYIYPVGEGLLQWRRLIDAAAKVDLVAIVNIENGPGDERIPEYSAIIAEAAERGLRLVGYVNTEYARRPASDVKRDVDAWVRLYPRIVGFFLDQQPNDPQHAAYIADLQGYAKGKLRGATVITNPGVPCDESYLARRASDLVCVFQKFEGFEAFELPAHLKLYDSSRFAALVYQVADAATMRSMLKEAIIKRIGTIYVTDGKPLNPWSRLPNYFEAEVEAMARLQ